MRASDEQLETAEMIIGEPESADDSVTFWMEDSGEMGVSTTRDGLTGIAYFGQDGNLNGDWIY